MMKKDTYMRTTEDEESKFGIKKKDQPKQSMATRNKGESIRKSLQNCK